MTLSADLAPPRTRPVWKNGPRPFPDQIFTTGHPDKSPVLRLLSLEDTVAHKVSGMYTHGIRTLETRCDDCISRGGGLFNCKMGDLPFRTQDMIDLIMVIMNSSWDAPATYDMLHKEFAWRLEQGEQLKVPPAFEIPNPDWFGKFKDVRRRPPLRRSRRGRADRAGVPRPDAAQRAAASRPVGPRAPAVGGGRHRPRAGHRRRRDRPDGHLGHAAARDARARARVDDPPVSRDERHVGRPVGGWAGRPDGGARASTTCPRRSWSSSPTG